MTWRTGWCRRYWAGGGNESYGYGPDGKRVWRTKATGGQTDVYFYGVGGQRQWAYRWNTVNANGDIGFYLVGLDPVIPKGLQMNRDRLGSVMKLIW